MSNPPRKVLHLPKVRMSGASGLRITHVKSIKPDAETLKKQEEDKLRAQLQKEIVSRSRACAYKRYTCTLGVLSGRQYCARHILSDPSAPYKRCAHDKCGAPANEREEHGLCFEHARAVAYARQRTAAPAQPPVTTETLLHHLHHYVKPERLRTASCASAVSVVSEPEHDAPPPGAADPFKQIDATSVNASTSSAMMEWCSGSDSDGDSVTLGEGGTCRASWDDADAEDAPCEDAPLWCAGVFTAEEAVSEARNTLRSLQSAYVSQMGRLRALLVQARRGYMARLRTERETFCSINAQAARGPLTVRERRQLRKLKAYASYRRRHGVDAVLVRKLHRKRARVKDPSWTRPLPSQGRCVFSEGGVRCAAAVLPAAKHCHKHVLHDTHQVLFVACGDARGGVPCREPAARLPLPSAACRYHTQPPNYTVFTLKKDNSDSDSDSEASMDSQMTVPAEHHEETVIEEPLLG